MARKTKAEQQAERDAARAARLLAMAELYPARLMAVLERAVKANFELTVKNSMFVVEDRDDRRADFYQLTNEFSVDADSALDNLEWAVENKEEERAEAVRQRELRRQAFDKLTVEERNALGLNSEFNW
jgi:hypothetical protein